MPRPVALVFDEYDAGRPDVMFVIQRVLESEGKLTLLETGRVIHPHPYFRLFATANTVGLGDPSGLYHGTQPINQGQMDRWNIVARLDYLPLEAELGIVRARVPQLDAAIATQMVQTAQLTREGFAAGDLSTVMSPRTVVTWAENYRLFGSLGHSFKLTFYNKCDEAERATLAEYYQRCTSEDLDHAAAPTLKFG